VVQNGSLPAVTTWDFSDLIARLEASARTQPDAFRRSVFGYVVLGYFCLAICFGLLLFYVAAGTYLFVGYGLQDESSHGLRADFGLLLIALAIGIVIHFVILWARHRQAEASVPLDLSEYPELSKTLKELSQQLRAPRIREIRISGEINARAAYEGVLSLIGLGRPVLYLGVPLISFVSSEQLRALIAHELVHFAIGHHKFGWLYRVQYPWTILSKLISTAKGSRITAVVQISFFWVNPFIKWYLPRLQARYQVVQRILDEVLTDRESIKVVDPTVYGSLLIQSAVLGWLDINFRVELEREARRTGVPTLDLTQRRLIYLAERIKTFPLRAAVWLVLGQGANANETHPSLAARLALCGLRADRKDPWVLDQLSALLTFTSVEHPPIQITRPLKDLDARIYDEVAEKWATASVDARSYSSRLQFLDKKLAANQLSEVEAWERLQLIGLFGPKARHHEEIRKFKERYPDNVGGKILSAALDLQQGDSTAPEKIEEWIRQAPDYTLMAVEALEHYYAKQLRFGEAEQQTERRRALVQDQKALERERATIRPGDNFNPSSISDEQRSALATKLARTGLVKRAYLVSKAVEMRQVPSFEILGLKLSRGSANLRQRQVQLQQLTSVLRGTGFTTLFLEKQYTRLENVFRRVPNAKINLYKVMVEEAAVNPSAIAANIPRDLTKRIDEPIKGPTPQPLPSSIPFPLAAPASEAKIANPGLLELAALTAVSVFASIIVVGVFVSHLNLWQTANSSSPEARAEKEMNVEETISQLTEAIRKDPNNPSLFLQRGGALANARRDSEAIDDYSRVVKLQPDNAQAYFLRGNLEEYLGQSVRALVDYGQVIRLDPKPVGAYQRRGKLYFKLQRYDEAISDLTKVIVLETRPQSGYWDRAMAYAASHNHQKAIEDYTAALNLGMVPNILVERGEEYLKSGDYQSALNDFNDVMRLKGQSLPARFGRAHCYYQLHDYDHVIEDCTAVIKLAPRFVEPYQLRAQAYRQKQQLAEANADLETAKRLQPK
jgi:tetratricopeptide (TPR) repeat protein/Zn-dependent protease with chaperone function